MKKLLKKYKIEILLVSALMMASLAVKSINYAGHLNFMQDQADDSAKALVMFRTGEPILIGSPTAFIYEGRWLFQGPLIFYTYGFFQLIGGNDPILASYLFTIVSVLTAVPLYFGVRMLFDKKTALATAALYLLVPYYVNYTRFMWNPNFQFALVPLLFLTMGLFKKTARLRWLTVTGIISGLLLHYHFQLVPVIAFVYGWFLAGFRKQGNTWKQTVSKSSFFILGFMIGWSPYIFFELRNRFYNTQTVILFLTHHKVVISTISNSKSPVAVAYYWLSTSLIILPFVIHRITGRFNKPLWLFIAGCAAISLYWAAHPLTHPFLGPPHWYVKDEIAAHRIIASQRLDNFAVSMLHYDNLASVQKFLMTAHNTPGAVYNYRTNKYLFAVSGSDDFSQYGAYEIREFTPRKLLRTWKINNSYNLYLFERTKE